MPNKQNTRLRRSIRQQRMQLSPSQLRQAAQRLARNAHGFTPLFKAQRIASYQSFQGEIPTHALINQLVNTDIYLPRIDSFLNSSMRFYPSTQATLRNRYGIVEPAGFGAPQDLRHCDAVLVPLVAFDRQGNRMGMGAGFYDRALSFRQHQQHLKRPILIGLAHAFQEVTSLTPQVWDVPMDAIITDQELIRLI